MFTTDPDQALRVADRIEAGMVFVNIVGADAAELPFGGVKRSGFGRELGRYATEEFVNRKMIRVAPEDAAMKERIAASAGEDPCLLPRCARILAGRVAVRADPEGPLRGTASVGHRVRVVFRGRIGIRLTQCVESDK